MDKLDIRCIDGGYFLREIETQEKRSGEGGALCMGDAVKRFQTWEDADRLRQILCAAYCKGGRL